MNIPQELLQAVMSILVSALQASAANEIASNLTNSMGVSSQRAKIPTFSITKYRISEGTTIQDYFKRFDWTLKCFDSVK